MTERQPGAFGAMSARTIALKSGGDASIAVAVIAVAAIASAAPALISISRSVNP